MKSDFNKLSFNEGIVQGSKESDTVATDESNLASFL
jgi:hypothetical protein